MEIRDTLAFAAKSEDALPLLALTDAALEPWLAQAPERVAAFVTSQGFKAAAGRTCVIPGEDGRPMQALAGLGGPKDAQRKRFVMGAAAASLPKLRLRSTIRTRLSRCWDSRRRSSVPSELPSLTNTISSRTAGSVSNTLLARSRNRATVSASL